MADTITLTDEGHWHGEGLDARVVFEAHRGPLTAGQGLDRICPDPGCFSPHHHRPVNFVGNRPAPEVPVEAPEKPAKAPAVKRGPGRPRKTA